MNNEAILEKINAGLKDKVLEAAAAAPRRINLKVDRQHLLGVLAYLKEQFNMAHLATISGVDLGESFEVIYHLSNDAVTVNVRMLTPRQEPRIPSVCSLIPGAILYERELQDMFGMVVENIPDPRRLLLCDDWPEGQYPLRKDWKFERPAEIIPGGK
ncbi:MAG: NADH-quinone oxidoreductase subunit C [Acidobacteria bacterium]|jgi:Ni,Fe-hydrogenase III component G|nr:NADH-quinone oxidoreductase subunit C [Acidobacteriota bacterium]